MDIWNEIREFERRFNAGHICDELAESLEAAETESRRRLDLITNEAPRLPDNVLPK